MRECGRRASFIIAAKSMNERGIGTFARLLNSSKYKGDVDQIFLRVHISFHIRRSLPQPLPV
jgi:hypothetical protein